MQQQQQQAVSNNCTPIVHYLFRHLYLVNNECCFIGISINRFIFLINYNDFISDLSNRKSNC